VIFVDADACPVRNEISAIASGRRERLLFVASYNHKPGDIKGYGEWSFVDPDAEASDMYILNHIQNKDILITHDIGLASLALQKGAVVLSPTGHMFTENEMDTALHLRYWARKERERGHYGKGPKPFGTGDRHHFQTRFLSKYDD
jgi:hypothetical protein